MVGVLIGRSRSHPVGALGPWWQAAVGGCGVWLPHLIPCLGALLRQGRTWRGDKPFHTVITGENDHDAPSPPLHPMRAKSHATATSTPLYYTGRARLGAKRHHATSSLRRTLPRSRLRVVTWRSAAEGPRVQAPAVAFSPSASARSSDAAQAAPPRWANCAARGPGATAGTESPPRTSASGAHGCHRGWVRLVPGNGEIRQGVWGEDETIH